MLLFLWLYAKQVCRDRYQIINNTPTLYSIIHIQKFSPTVYSYLTKSPNNLHILFTNSCAALKLAQDHLFSSYLYKITSLSFPIT